MELLRKTDMKQVTLNEYLNAKNVWVEKLLGDVSCNKRNRTLEQIEKEYNIDVYAKRLEEARNDLEGFRKRLLYSIYDTETFATVNDEIYLMPACMYTALRRNRIMQQIEKYLGDESICELGAGNGQNIIWLQEYQNRKLYGGEYSENAVTLARMLGFEMYKFNYYEESDYSLIKPNSSILTVHSIEQISDAATVIDSLRKMKHNINYVLNFEPIRNQERKDLIGFLRNKYAEINDYNHNLLDLLKNGEDIEIVHSEFDAFGNNPLNPTSIFVWKFV